ncbi:EamA family transporter [Kitasatospora sp. NPDC048296]|uniref:EamA family transporter n=1 Tax=Kitasatospora sp. NPDC048296 TaxID=3364048 RepID=UPI00371BAFA9
MRALRGITLGGLGAIGYVGLVSTLFGFVAWSYLLRSYDATAVAPYSLLVPVFGMSSAWLLLGERVSPLAGAAALLVIAGIGITALRPGLPSAVVARLRGSGPRRSAALAAAPPRPRG